MNREEIIALLHRYRKDEYQPGEKEQLIAQLLAADEDTKAALTEQLTAEEQITVPYNADRWEPVLQKVLQVDKQTAISINRSSMRTMRRWAAAAILILAIGSGIYYFNNQSYQSQKSNKSQFKTMVQDIPPGTSKAILTLSNGMQKELSIADNGLHLQADAVLLTTPDGGQYQAVLPDGSKVWLNAASSIKFPSKFNKERRVEVTGEVYFEIAKDATRPFKVSSEGQEIEVLGTSFNINTYSDEPVVKTTLVSGSIKITCNNQAAILKPGQQAIIANHVNLINQGAIQVQTTNTDQDLAWKNNLFNFEGVDIIEMMRPIARWYNIEIKYEGTVQAREFKGRLSRELKLSQVLKILDEMQINYEMEGRTLTIIGNK